MTWTVNATHDGASLVRDEDTVTLKHYELGELIEALRRAKRDIVALRREARKKGKCEYCGGVFERSLGPGRPRIHCSDVCRKKMLRTVYQPEWNARELRRERGRNAFK